MVMWHSYKHLRSTPTFLRIPYDVIDSYDHIFRVTIAFECKLKILGKNNKADLYKRILCTLLLQTKGKLFLAFKRSQRSS